jgi:hypothetical protein
VLAVVEEGDDASVQTLQTSPVMLENKTTNISIIFIHYI